MTETVIERLKAMKHPEWNTDVARAWPKLLAVVEAAQELLYVAELRGDDVLPHPANDPRLWAARMQKAWDDAKAALAELGKEAK